MAQIEFVNNATNTELHINGDLVRIFAKNELTATPHTEGKVRLTFTGTNRDYAVYDADDFVTPSGANAEAVCLALRAYFFSAGSGGGGNVVDGTVTNSTNRWSGSSWVEDVDTLNEDATENQSPAPFSNFLKRILTRWAAAAEAFTYRAVSRLNSSGSPNPLGTIVSAGAGVEVRSLVRTGLNAFVSAVLVPSSEKAYALLSARRYNIGDASLTTATLEVSVQEGLKMGGLGFQPTRRSHTANNDSVTMTNQDHTLVVYTGIFTNNSDPTHFDCTVNLPASPTAAQYCTVINAGEGVVIVNGNGNEILYGQYAHYLSGNNSTATFQWDGNVWRLVSPLPTQYTAKYADGTTLNSVYAAGYTPSKCFVRNALIKILNEDGVGDNTYIRITANNGNIELVAPFQITDNAVIPINIFHVQALSIEVEVTTQTTRNAEDFVVFFELANI